MTAIASHLRSWPMPQARIMVCLIVLMKMRGMDFSGGWMRSFANMMRRSRRFISNLSHLRKLQVGLIRQMSSCSRFMLGSKRYAAGIVIKTKRGYIFIAVSWRGFCFLPLLTATGAIRHPLKAMSRPFGRKSSPGRLYSSAQSGR